MVARDPMRKVTLDPRNPKADVHVGSVVNIGKPVEVKQTGTAAGTSSADSGTPDAKPSKSKD